MSLEVMWTSALTTTTTTTSISSVSVTSKQCWPTPSGSESDRGPWKRASTSGRRSFMSSSPTSATRCHLGCLSAVCLLADRFIMLEPHVHASHSSSKCLDLRTQRHLVCKSLPPSAASALLTAHHRVSGVTSHVNRVEHVVHGQDRVHVLFDVGGGDLHGHVRHRRRLRESEAKLIFGQVVNAVHAAHGNGVVVRDLKLRKFVFVDNHTRNRVHLESLEDCVVLEAGESDTLSDKHGCPAYVSPEVLQCDVNTYSGKAADMWGLGVMLYTMLVGRYPFHGEEHTGLFAQIRNGVFKVPDHVSMWARSLIHNLLNLSPEQRPSTDEVLSHPWLLRHSQCTSTSKVVEDRQVPQRDHPRLRHQRRFSPLLP